MGNPVNLDALKSEQSALARRVSTRDWGGPVRLIAGVDVSYAKDSACAAIVVLDAQTLNVVEKAHCVSQPVFPYIPQFLAYRELPLLDEVIRQLTSKPDLFFYDGNGMLHKRRCGAASHFGVTHDVPVIGCSKNPALPLEKIAGDRGAVADIELEGNRVGVQLITQDKLKPIYVSVGHMVSLSRAIEEVLKFSPKFRIPEPIRQADQLSRSILKNL